MTTVYLAEVNTGSFTFQAIAATEADAVKALRNGWATHVEQYRPPVPEWSHYADDVNVTEFTLGHAHRDGQPL